MPQVLPPRGWQPATQVSDYEWSEYILLAQAEGYSYEQAVAMARGELDTRNPHFSPVVAGATALVAGAGLAYVLGTGAAAVASSSAVTYAGQVAYLAMRAAASPLTSYLAARSLERALDSSYRVYIRGELPSDLVKLIGRRAHFDITQSSEIVAGGAEGGNCVPRALGVARALNGAPPFSAVRYELKDYFENLWHKLGFMELGLREIIEEMVIGGHRSHGIILAKGGTGVEGHAFNVVNWRGTIYFLEGDSAAGGARTLSYFSAFNRFWFTNMTGKSTDHLIPP